ncbi:hypothetical protein LCGC14_0442040 [marine sediment metagenome]|uniref:Uncharacterized protein n=1 Tax=marine sediment metagenome TaxID=412755 RepID=A0A0F9SK38_9ZZZZ
MVEKKVNIIVSHSTWKKLFYMKTGPSHTFDAIISKLIENDKKIGDKK